MEKILLVEDGDFFRNTLKIFIKKNGYAVIEASNGSEAKEVLSIRNDIDLIISDVKMPKLNGIELLHWVKRNMKIPIILMTGFSELLEIKEAYELGADEFLPKPFDNTEALDAVKRCLEGAANKSGKKRELDDDFCKVPIDDFVIGNEIPFNIFIRLSKYKYAKIAHKGESIALERIQAYREKSVKFLYLRKEDFQECVGFNVSLSKRVTQSDKIPKEKRDKFLKYTGELIMEHLFVVGVNEQLLKVTKEFFMTSLGVLSNDPNPTNLIMLLSENEDFLYAHSLGVSIYSVMIARQLKWHWPAMHFKLSMAGLFHDIGKRNLDKKVLESNPEYLTRKEVDILKEHPVISAETIKDMDSLPSDIYDIVFQHHEECQGGGYPKGLKKNQIHPLARILSVANIFCNYTIKNPVYGSNTPKDTIALMEMNLKGKIDPVPFAALKNIFGLF